AVGALLSSGPRTPRGRGRGQPHASVAVSPPFGTEGLIGSPSWSPGSEASEVLWSRAATEAGSANYGLAHGLALRTKSLASSPQSGAGRWRLGGA
ncbi:unnamed protein product, partial [Polarella glacialis]